MIDGFLVGMAMAGAMGAIMFLMHQDSDSERHLPAARGQDPNRKPKVVVRTEEKEAELEKKRAEKRAEKGLED